MTYFYVMRHYYVNRLLTYIYVMGYSYLMNITSQIQALIDQGALFAINTSGGKDSQAMGIKMLELGIPARQLVFIHADLGDVEWKGTLEHAQAQADAAGIPFVVARARDGHGNDKGFFDMLDQRLNKNQGEVVPVPTPKYRQCTSDLKRTPIERELKAYMRANGFSVVVSCEGIRAAESAQRSKRKVLTRLGTMEEAGRTAFTWLPIFDMTTAQVFATIAQAGQQPHWAYAAGNERLSCVFCIMGSRTDLANGARHNPELFDTYVTWERQTGFHIHADGPLAELVAEGQAILDRLAKEAA